MNNLDTVWASLSSADRIVLLGHDRDILTDAEKAQLASLAADRADRRTQPRTARKPGARASQRGTGQRGTGQRATGQRGRGRGAARPRKAA